MFLELVQLAPVYAQSTISPTLDELRRISETQQQQIEHHAQVLSQLQSQVEKLSNVASRAKQKNKKN